MRREPLKVGSVGMSLWSQYLSWDLGKNLESIIQTEPQKLQYQPGIYEKCKLLGPKSDHRIRNWGGWGASHLYVVSPPHGSDTRGLWWQSDSGRGVSNVMNRQCPGCYEGGDFLGTEGMVGGSGWACFLPSSPQLQTFLEQRATWLSRPELWDGHFHSALGMPTSQPGLFPLQESSHLKLTAGGKQGDLTGLGFYCSVPSSCQQQSP